MKSSKLGPEDTWDLNLSGVVLLSLEVTPVLAKLEQYLARIHLTGFQRWGMVNKGFKVLMCSMLVEVS